jgi:hypothetical protein
MKFYYLSTNPNEDGHFEIHHRECPNIPAFHDRLYLGPFNSGHEALNQAQSTNSRSVICKVCQSASMLPRFSGFSDSDQIKSNS